VTSSDLPQSALHCLIRTQERVLLDDALADTVYSNNEYVRLKRSRSVLCLPITCRKTGFVDLPPIQREAANPSSSWRAADYSSMWNALRL
jgi:hypothetical protein